MGRRSCGFEAGGFNELVEIVDGALVEAVELRSVLAVEPGVGLDGREEPGSRLGVDAFEELQEDETDRVAVEEEPVAARVPWREVLKDRSARSEGIAIAARAEASTTLGVVG